MEKIVKIGEADVKLKATAALPRLYRMKFGRDILQDMTRLQGAATEVSKGKNFSKMDLEIFENCAYIMARQGDPENVPDDVGEWLDGFDGPFDIYQALPEVLELWGMNISTTVESKKKLRQVAEK